MNICFVVAILLFSDVIFAAPSEYPVNYTGNHDFTKRIYPRQTQFQSTSHKSTSEMQQSSSNSSSFVQQYRRSTRQTVSNNTSAANQSPSIDDAIIFDIFKPQKNRIGSPNQTKPSSSKSKAEFQCNEYARETVSLRTSTEVDTKEIGFYVSGGTPVLSGEYPHVVALGRVYENDFLLMCGSTLISHTWLLTAAHCTYGPEGGPTLAWLGNRNLTTDLEGIKIPIQRMIRHPQYYPPAMYADIALAKLSRSVTFNTLIQPACLNYPTQTIEVGSAYVCGWGVTDIGGDLSNILLKAELDLIDNPTCRMQHNISREVPRGVEPTMICAGDPHGEWKKDSCEGDSGGPLQVFHPRHHKAFLVIGITSFGPACTTGKIPGVYTRVSPYVPWIDGIVWSEEK